MKIIADKDIFRVEDYFSRAGELILLPGRDINAGHVADADALLVRTVTRIDQDLLMQSSVRFVGSASSGFDHVDREWLQGNGIHFFHAAGCNAEAVVNYVFAVLALLSSQRQADWRQWSVGIIGGGNVGSRLARKLESLGMAFAVYDPFLAPAHPLYPQLATLEEVLRQDVVTVHTPLTRDGPFPTWHMLDESRLASMRPRAILINAARGEVVDNDMLYNFLGKRPDIGFALDVWENEPAIHKLLMQAVDIATPHIAGYSMNGKRNGTQWVYRAFIDFFELPDSGMVGANDAGPLMLDVAGTSVVDYLNKAILTAYPIREDFIGKGLGATGSETGSRFDSLRNEYHFRPEFSDFKLDRRQVPEDLAADLQVLGFALV